MIKIKGIKSLYNINLAEGEGLGTAYEYYIKLRKLKKFINSIKNLSQILIAGLPQKYGLSMDFFLLGQMLQAETVVVDERPDILERAQKVFQTLNTKKIFGGSKVFFLKTERIERFTGLSSKNRRFDLALSSEVLQRLDGARGIYISNLIRLAENFALFAPNRENRSHARWSGLSGVSLEELTAHCVEGDSKADIFDCGYLDMPPFPPGLSRSKEKRQQAAESRLEALLMKGLEIYNLGESLIPDFIKKRKAHIVYALVKSP
ncbi:MAG: hypothetical protein ACLFVG_02665 [Candidatus Aminicenantes bacterium]